MAMQRIEDMNGVELDALVSVLLEDDPKMAAQVKPQPIRLLKDGDSEGVWELLGEPQGGFRRGELNIICVGGRTR